MTAAYGDISEAVEAAMEEYTALKPIMIGNGRPGGHLEASASGGRVSLWRLNLDSP